MGSLLDTTGSKQHVPHRTLRPPPLLLPVFFYFSFIPYYILFYWGVRTDVLFVPSGRGKSTERKRLVTGRASQWLVWMRIRE